MLLNSSKGKLLIHKYLNDIITENTKLEFHVDF